MWFVYASVLLAVIVFAVRKYGWHFYRFGRPLFLRRIVGKTRPATPPLDDRRRGSHSKEHSVFQVYDDGTIISSKIEKPQMVNDRKLLETEMRSPPDVDALRNSSQMTFEWKREKLLTSQSKCDDNSRLNRFASFQCWSQRSLLKLFMLSIRPD